MNIRRRVSMVVAGVACAAVTATCGGGDSSITGPGLSHAGTLEVRLDQSAPNTGAVIVSVSGASIEDAVIADGFSGKVVTVSSTTVRIFVRGALGPGIIARISVPDTRVAYSAQLLEAAANSAGGYAVLSAGQYALRVVAQ